MDKWIGGQGNRSLKIIDFFFIRIRKRKGGLRKIISGKFRKLFKKREDSS